MLSDRDIKEAILRKSIQIEPFSEDNLTPNGYDLTVGEIYIEGEKKKEAKIAPLKWFAISTKEYIKLKDVTAQLWIRSTYARKGVLSSFGKVDVGFEGCLTLSCFNARQEIEIKEGDRFCQIVFERLASKPSKYYEGKYKGQKTIKL
ncbi:MAG: dCTP deaminase [Thermoplasmata archaeon]|nr:MAG: dCTP deaminase [Thermoplasmata archaeon]